LSTGSLRIGPVFALGGVVYDDGTIHPEEREKVRVLAAISATAREEMASPG